MTSCGERYSTPPRQIRHQQGALTFTPPALQPATDLRQHAQWPPVRPAWQAEPFCSVAGIPSASKVQRTVESELMAALTRDDEAAVGRILHAHAEAAKERFNNSLFEPPLCFAVRNYCSRRTLLLLLQHGANPNDLDANGKSAIMLLCETWKSQFWRIDGGQSPFAGSGEHASPDEVASAGATQPVALPDFPIWGQEPGPLIAKPVALERNESAVIKVALLLLSHGANPEHDNGRGKNAVLVAEEAGAHKLASALRHYQVAQAYLTLSLVGTYPHSRHKSLYGLPQELVRRVSSFFLPAEIEHSVRHAADSLSADAQTSELSAAGF